jgi:arylsulfatase A-like enzyme
MGLAHGGLRQKTFNVYEETINVPLVFSNPRLFPSETRTEALASLVDVLPTMLALGGRAAPPELRGHDLTPILAAASDPRAAAADDVDLSPVTEHAAPARSVQDAIHFTYDDHQAGTATRNAPGQPNRIRSIRTATGKYAFYFDPNGRAASEYELYDVERDPLEIENLVDVRSGAPRSDHAARLQRELSERLELAMSDCATAPRITSASA